MLEIDIQIERDDDDDDDDGDSKFKFLARREKCLRDDLNSNINVEITFLALLVVPRN